MTHVEANLLAYLDGELSPVDVQAIEAHLAECPACRAALVEMRALQAGLTRVLPAVYASVHLPAEAEQRIRAQLGAAREREERAGASQGWLRSLRAGLWTAFRPLSQAAIPVMALFFLILTGNAARLPVQTGVQEMLVLGQNTFAPGSAGAVRVLLRDGASGQPIANAAIDVRMRQAGLAKTVYSGSTDTTGSAPVQFAVPSDWEGDAELVVAASSDLGADEVSSPIRLARSYRLLLSSDKPVYQPGETIHLRTLALGAVDSLPAAGAAVRFEVLDPQGVALLSQEVTASEFGIAAVDLPLSAEATQGTYRLRAALDDTVSELSVDVNQAELPQFLVEVQADAPYYLPGQMLIGQVDARYFFGKPVAGGDVTLQVLASGQGQGPAAGDQRFFVQEVRGQTDENGHFAFQFELPTLPDAAFAPLQAGGPEATLALDLEATVSDRIGNREFGWQKLSLARQPILIDVVAEGGALRTGVENILYVLTSYPDGRPATTSVAVQIGAGAPIAEVTSAAGIAEVRYTPRAGDIGARTVNVTATDAADQQGNAEVILPLDAARETLLLRTDRAIYAVGDTMALEALATGAMDAVYLDVIKAGQLMLTQSAPVQDGKATFALDLTPELAGTLELNAYQVGSDNNALRDARVVIVDAPETLQVQLATDKAEYRPGEEALLSAQVQTAADSQPAEAAVSLSVVNEAVYAQRPYQPGFARAYFLVDEALREAGVQPAPDAAQVGGRALQLAQQQMAKATWAAYTGQAYTLAVQSSDEASAAAINSTRAATFSRLSVGLSLALSLTVLALAGIVIAGLRRSGVLGKAAGRLLVTLTLLAIGGAAVVVGLSQLVADALAAQTAWLMLLISGGLWLAALLALAVYAWRQRDHRAQYAVLLVSAYVLGLALLAFAVGQGAVLAPGWLAVLAGGFGVLLAALLLFGWGLRLEGERRAGIVVLLLALLVLPVVVALNAVDLSGNQVIRQIAGPTVHVLRSGLLTGCTAPLAPQSAPAPASLPEDAAGKQVEVAPQPLDQGMSPTEAQAIAEPETVIVMEALEAPAEVTAAAPEAALQAVETTAPLAEPLLATTTLPTATVELSPTIDATFFMTAVVTPTIEVTTTVALTATPTLTATVTPTATLTPTAAPEGERSLARAAGAATDTPQPTATPQPTPTAEPTATPLPTAASTPEPTATPLPAPTATPEPTPLPPVIGLEAFGLGAGGEATRTGEPVDISQLPIVRERFPQTLYWNPQVVTDGQGRTQVRIPTGDVITTWRITALAVDRAGRLGSATAPLVVFQPLFLNLSLPATAMAVGGELYAGVQIFNYSTQPLSIALTAQTSPGLAARLSASQVTVPANEIMVVPLRLTALSAGEQTITVAAVGDSAQDARQAVITVQGQ